MPDKETLIDVFLAGPGKVGRAVINLLGRRSTNSRAFRLKLAGAASRNNWLIEPEGINTSEWRTALLKSAEKPGIINFINRIKKLNSQAPVFIDATAGSDIIPFYKDLLESGIPVVTPNKKALSGSYEDYLSLKRTAVKNNTGFGYSANVGAGLPMLGLIRELRAGGDEITGIEGILSGSVNYILGKFNEGMKFARAVELAAQNGYTEPDPRDDLDGIDTARKLLILLREAGIRIEPEDIEVESLMKFNTGSYDEDLALTDSYFENLRLENMKHRQLLAYTASFAGGKAFVSLKKVEEKSFLAGLSGSENLLSINTTRYADNPLIIKGIGAGPEVTASGIISDIIKIFGGDNHSF